MLTVVDVKLKTKFTLNNQSKIIISVFMESLISKKISVSKKHLKNKRNPLEKALNLRSALLQIKMVVQEDLQKYVLQLVSMEQLEQRPIYVERLNKDDYYIDNNFVK
jgi:hypothetical protein